MIRRRQAPNSSLCFAANEKGWRQWWAKGLSSSSPFLISYRIQWWARGPSSSCCVLSITCKNWQWAPDSSLFSDVLFINSKRQWQASARHHLFLFCFCAPKGDDNESVLVIVVFFLFSLCAPREDDDEHACHHLFCFLSIHPKTMMMN